MMAWNGATKTKACDSRTIQHETQDEQVHLPPAFGTCFLLCLQWMGFVAQKHAVYREIHDGVGQVWQELSMELNLNMAKTGSPINTTIDHRSGRG